MISGKMIVFPVFVCILGKCSEKYSTLCVWSNVKQNKEKTHTQNHWNPPKREPPLPSANHPNPPRNPPRAKPPSKSTQNPFRNPSKPAAQNQKSNSKSTKSHQFQPTGNNETHHRQNHNPKPATIKPLADLVNLKNKNPDLVLMFLASPGRSTPCQASPCLVASSFVRDSSSCSRFSRP